jgi:hypothetical protein
MIVGNPEILIKALPGREELRLVAQVPFAEHAGSIACRLKHFSNGRFFGVEPHAPF